MTREKRHLMPHQSDVFRRFKHKSTMGLFLEMRLGKTLLAIRWAETRPRCKKILVACPKPVIPSWQRELEEEGIESVDLTGRSMDERADRLLEDQDKRWFLVNKEGLTERGHKTRTGRSKAVPSFISRLPWDACLLDESTFVRSPRALVTQVALGYLSQSPYRGILTGLPNPEGPEDFVTQMMFLRGQTRFMGCGNYWDWRAEHMQASGYDWAIKRDALKRLKEEVKQDCVFLTRKQAGIGNQKIREQREVDVPKKILKALRTAEKDFEVGDRLAMNKLQAITWMLQLAGGRYPDEDLHHDAKLRELVYLATTELKGQPIVVWCHYTSEIKACARALEKAGIRTIIAYGRNDAAAQAHRFHESKKIRAIVAQPACLKMGIDMSRSSTAIYYSNYYDYEIRRQSEDRIEHPKKSEPLLLIDLVARGTIDEDLMMAIRDKKFESESFANNRGFLRKMFENMDRRMAA